jgi:nucleotide-binding universal stress UspA family protein
MKSILVPFDFSPYAVAALKTAYKISKKSGAEILCVTIIPTLLDWNFLSDQLKAKNAQVQEEYDEAVEFLPTYLFSILPTKTPLKSIIKIGVPSESILNVANEYSPDLIVIGAYGKGYQDGDFIGSNLQKVIRNAHCPILAVKEALDGNHFRKLAFASNFSVNSSDSFKLVKPLVKLFRASVHLVHINTPTHFENSSETLDRMGFFMKGHEEVTFHLHVFNHRETEKGLIEFSELNQIKWVALESGHHEKNPGYQIGTTETLIFQSDLGVLSVKR